MSHGPTPAAPAAHGAHGTHGPAADHAHDVHGDAAGRVVGEGIGEMIEDFMRDKMKGKKFPESIQGAAQFLESIPFGTAATRVGAHVGADRIAHALTARMNMSRRMRGFVNTLIENTLAGTAVGALDAATLSNRLHAAADQIEAERAAGNVEAGTALFPDPTVDAYVHRPRKNRADGSIAKNRHGEYMGVCARLATNQAIWRRSHPATAPRKERGPDGKTRTVPGSTMSTLEVDPGWIDDVTGDANLCPDCFPSGSAAPAEDHGHDEHGHEAFLDAIGPEGREVLLAWMERDESWVDEFVGGDLLSDVTKHGMNVPMFMDAVRRIRERGYMRADGTLDARGINLLREVIEKTGPGRRDAQTQGAVFLSRMGNGARGLFQKAGLPVLIMAAFVVAALGYVAWYGVSGYIDHFLDAARSFLEALLGDGTTPMDRFKKLLYSMALFVGLTWALALAQGWIIDPFRRRESLDRDPDGGLRRTARDIASGIITVGALAGVALLGEHYGGSSFLVLLAPLSPLLVYAGRMFIRNGEADVSPELMAQNIKLGRFLSTVSTVVVWIIIIGSAFPILMGLVPEVNAAVTQMRADAKSFFEGDAALRTAVLWSLVALALLGVLVWKITDPMVRKIAAAVAVGAILLLWLPVAANWWDSAKPSRPLVVKTPAPTVVVPQPEKRIVVVPGDHTQAHDAGDLKVLCAQTTFEGRINLKCAEHGY